MKFINEPATGSQKYQNCWQMQKADIAHTTQEALPQALPRGQLRDQAKAQPRIPLQARLVLEPL